jgi:hypothetical protein
MEELAWIGAAVGVVLVFTATAWAWWRQRARMIDIQRRLTWSEQSGCALGRHAHEVDLRLAAMSQALEALQMQGAPRESTPGDANERRRLMEETLGRADAAAAATLAQADPAHASAWPATEPLPLTTTFYAPTMPLELRDEDRVIPMRQAGVRTTVKQ